MSEEVVVRYEGRVDARSQELLVNTSHGSSCTSPEISQRDDELIAKGAFVGGNYDAGLVEYARIQEQLSQWSIWSVRPGWIWQVLIPPM